MNIQHKKLNQGSEIAKSIGYFGKCPEYYGFGQVNHMGVIIPAGSTVILPDKKIYTIVEDCLDAIRSSSNDYKPDSGCFVVERNQERERIALPFAFIDSFSQERYEPTDKDFYVISRPLSEEAKEDLRPQIKHILSQYKQGLIAFPVREGEYLRVEKGEGFEEQVYEISSLFRKAVIVAEGLGNIHEEELIESIQTTIEHLDKFYRRFSFGKLFSNYWNLLPYNATGADEADKDGLEQLISFIGNKQIRQELSEQVKEGTKIIEENYIHHPKAVGRFMNEVKGWEKIPIGDLPTRFQQFLVESGLKKS